MDIMMERTQFEYEQLLASSDMYQLMSMFLRLPTAELVEGLREGSLKQDVQDIFGELGVPAEETASILENLSAYEGGAHDPQEVLSDLRREYTRMFTHPKQPAVSIYEALFLWNGDDGEPKPSLFISPAALDAERCYKRAGLERSKEVNESGDHFATQMEFMMFLCRGLAIAMQNEDEGKFSELEDVWEEFAKLHLHRWARPFFQECAELSANRAMIAFWDVGNIFFKYYLPSVKHG